jgi:serine/threonine protein kinase
MQGDDKGFRAKISDFGLSQHMTKGQNYVLVSKGTEAYLPVEVFQQLALTEKSDVYALGLVMWEIFYGIFWHAIYEKEKQRKGCALLRKADSPSLCTFQHRFLRASCLRWTGSGVYVARNLMLSKLVPFVSLSGLTSHEMILQQGLDAAKQLLPVFTACSAACSTKNCTKQ